MRAGVAVHVSFNPTLVRLRRTVVYGFLEHFCPFQSHAGSIEAPEDIPLRPPQAGFNPTLVRLRQGEGAGWDRRT